MSIPTALLATGITALGIAAGLAHRRDADRHRHRGGDGLCTVHHLPIGSHPQAVCCWRA